MPDNLEPMLSGNVLAAALEAFEFLKRTGIGLVRYDGEWFLEWPQTTMGSLSQGGFRRSSGPADDPEAFGGATDFVRNRANPLKKAFGGSGPMGSKDPVALLLTFKAIQEDAAAGGDPWSFFARTGMIPPDAEAREAARVERATAERMRNGPYDWRRSPLDRSAAEMLELARATGNLAMAEGLAFPEVVDPVLQAVLDARDRAADREARLDGALDAMDAASSAFGFSEPNQEREDEL